MNTIDYISLYGAILSTLAIIWNVYNGLQDRPRIKVKTHIGFFSNDTKTEFLFATIINKGKRSIFLTSFGLKGEEGNLIPNRITGIPCELEGGTSHYEFFKMDDLRGRQYKFAWFKDGTGKVYKSEIITEKLKNYYRSEKKSRELTR